MATLTSQIQGLIDYANETTGAGDTLLGDAVKTLVEGYGQGGSEEDKYIFLEYVQSDGTQFLHTFIDSQFLHKGEMEAVFSIPNLSEVSIPFGHTEGTYHAQFVACVDGRTRGDWPYNSYNNQLGTPRTYDSDSPNVYYQYPRASSNEMQGKFRYNGVEYEGLIREVSSVPDILLFAQRPGYMYPARFYSFWAKDAIGNYIINAKPCVRKSDGIVGMYDSVTQRMLIQEGDNPLIAGPAKGGTDGYVVIPSIRTEGNAWLDTELTGGSSSAYELAVRTYDWQSQGWAQFFSGLQNYPRGTSKLFCSDNTAVSATREGDNTKNLPLGESGGLGIIKIENGRCFFNGKDTGTEDFETNGWSTLSFYLGNSHSESHLPCKAVFQYLKMWKDGVLVRDYVPRKRVSDGKIGMLDLCGSICSVTGTPFYVSIGPEDFTVGLI